MREYLAAALDAVHVDELTRHVPIRSVRRAVRQGRLVRVLPGFYAAADDQPRPLTLATVTRSTGGAVSHQSALAAWDLIPDPATAPIHLTIPAERRIAPRVGVVIHRTRSMPRTVCRGGVAVVVLERSLIDSWTSLPEHSRRGPVIEAVRRRLTTAPRVQAALAARSGCRAAAELRGLLGLLERGCHSELEIWGVQQVLAIPGVPAAQHQIPVGQGLRRAYLDAGWEEVLLGVEFDGAASHSSAAQRESDLRRDAWLASLGWLILRFSYRRLMTDTERVRQEIRSAYEVRRNQLRRAG